MANKENIALVVAALRSDEYPQCRGVLNNGEGFCCLGVATEVAIKNGVEVTKRQFVGGGTVSYDLSTDLLPRAVQDWLDIYQGGNVDLLYDAEEHTAVASGLNDEEGWTFHQIADAFERTYLA